MSDALTKLRPDRDLQCYFFQPSAVAALNGTGPAGFTVSGCWREQFDWAVVEWNRDNVFDYPALRNLPDGDLSEICLSYQERRTNCIPIDSRLYPTVDWPYLRVWADSNGQETVYRVPLLDHATPLSSYVQATAEFELRGTITAGDVIELAWFDQHFNYQLAAGDTLESAVGTLAGIISLSQASALMTAAADGASVKLTYIGMPGSNGNRVGAYGTVHGAGTESWTPEAAVFTGGVTPASWQVNLDFSNLKDVDGNKVPTQNLRKLRWTWAADLQSGSYERSEFAVVISNWAVSGSKLAYSVAGPGSRRIEDTDPSMIYTGSWQQERGNYSAGCIHWTTEAGSSISCTYRSSVPHSLYLGTRYLDTGGRVTLQVDGAPSYSVDLSRAGEDVLVRLPLGGMAPGQHVVTATHAGGTGTEFHFDFLELAIPTTQLPSFATTPKTTLATDWDTEHSQVLAPERTAWLIQSLGFQGRANHYAGCLWFYELACSGQHYASAGVAFTGAPEFGRTTSIQVSSTQFDHVNLIGDTGESIARSFALVINSGATGVWARADGATLTITARAMGTAGNGITIGAVTNSNCFTAQASNPTLAGGVDGKWLTDLVAVPRLNRAARDWSSSYFRALASYGIGVAAGFSMELGNGDDSAAAGIAQRYPNGAACWLNTPSLQTNFGPESTAFWQQAYLDMAGVMTGAGVPVYLQFGEVQWWYFCPPADPAHGNWTPIPNGGMPFYDSYSTIAFGAKYGKAMHVFTDPANDPAPYPDECIFLPGLVGAFTQSIRQAVSKDYPTARFEALYAPDVNNAPLTRVINLPLTYWKPTSLACLKTENFTYTGNRNLDQADQSIQVPTTLGFSSTQSSHLIGVGDYTTPWAKEWSLAMSAGVESIVLFALDQFCLIGYALPLDAGGARSGYMGG